MKMLVKAITWDGKEVPHVKSVIADGNTEKEVLKKATEKNPQLKEILVNEPIAKYDESGRITNANEIRSAKFLILEPLE